MHKVKKREASIRPIIQMNQPISGVKSTLYDGLNKQPNLLGKINPKCVLSYIYPPLRLKTTHIGLFLTQCFSEYAEFQFIFVLREWKADGRKRHHIFGWLILQKSKDLFYCECTQIKANLLQFRLSSLLRGVVASTARRGKESSDQICAVKRFHRTAVKLCKTFCFT